MERELQEQCHNRARQTLAARAWELVEDEAGFLDGVVAEVEARLPLISNPSLESIAEHATVRRYGYVWHDACRASGSLRQHRAFEELNATLYRVAYYRTGGDRQTAQDCTQAALLSIWRNLERVEDPGSFLWWALTILINQINRSFAKGKRRRIDPDTGEWIWVAIEISATDLQPESREDDVEYQEPPVEPRPVMIEDVRLRLEAAAQNCLNNPMHHGVFIKTFLEGKSHREAATELGTTPENVAVFKQRALMHLRKCEKFLDVLEELL